MQWEFTYINLWLGDAETIHVANDCHAEIAKLGKEGWEPVGEVRFKFRMPSGITDVRHLMFKRPVA